MNRVGPRMREAMEYIREHPGCTKLAAAMAARPGRARTAFYGYRVVNRCIAAGLVLANHHPRCYSLTVPN